MKQVFTHSDLILLIGFAPEVIKLPFTVKKSASTWLWQLIHVRSTCAVCASVVAVNTVCGTVQQPAHERTQVFCLQRHHIRFRNVRVTSLKLLAASLMMPMSLWRIRKVSVCFKFAVWHSACHSIPEHTQKLLHDQDDLHRLWKCHVFLQNICNIGASWIRHASSVQPRSQAESHESEPMPFPL